MKSFYVYILANKPHGTLYVGVTNDLRRRTYEHSTHAVEGFTSKHNINALVYYEETPSIEAAILREKRLKHWKREWKVALIEENNPEWKDLGKDIFE